MALTRLLMQPLQSVASCCATAVWLYGITNDGSVRHISPLDFTYRGLKTLAFHLDFRPLAFFLQSRIGPGVISSISSVSM